MSDDFCDQCLAGGGDGGPYERGSREPDGFYGYGELADSGAADERTELRVSPGYFVGDLEVVGYGERAAGDAAFAAGWSDGDGDVRGRYGWAGYDYGVADGGWAGRHRDGRIDLQVGG
jgi:hypothetical protein